MKGIDHSYYYENYITFKTEDFIIAPYPPEEIRADKTVDTSVPAFYNLF